jgi:predicted nucleic acid-binding protein
MNRTDCISTEIIRRGGLSEALTNDEHFEKEGFTCLVNR